MESLIMRMVYGFFKNLPLYFQSSIEYQKNGSKVYFVNDNVRYGGEVNTVNFLSLEIAE